MQQTNNRMATSTTINDITTLMKKKLTLKKAKADTNQLAGMQLTVLPMPGIQDIKWVE